MTSDRSRFIAFSLTLLAGIVVLLHAPEWLRIPVMLAFAFLAPGLAFTRSIPELASIERFALVGAVSISLITAVTVALVQFDWWTTTSAFLAVGAVTLVGCLPRPRVLTKAPE